jgi:hypothetical protein
MTQPGPVNNFSPYQNQNPAAGYTYCDQQRLENERLTMQLQQERMKSEQLTSQLQNQQYLLDSMNSQGRTNSLNPQQVNPTTPVPGVPGAPGAPGTFQQSATNPWWTSGIVWAVGGAALTIGGGIVVAGVFALFSGPQRNGRTVQVIHPINDSYPLVPMRRAQVLPPRIETRRAEPTEYDRSEYDRSDYDR